MKKYIYILFTAALLVLTAGCSKDDDGPKTIHSDVVGEWHQTMWNGEEHAEFDVYVESLSDGTFNTYEKVESSIYVKTSGDFKVEGTRLSGRYDNGKPWRTDYEFELSGNDNTLTMTSNADQSVVSTYVRTTIPETIRNAQQCMLEVRSGLPGEYHGIF